ncbi:conjugal transfer protein TraH, partial [Escherichia coli]|nr:conjugal transfer protein TraH [Escherichia coli]
MKKAVITLFLWAFFPVVQANVSQDLDNFFNGMGYASNVTSPDAFESQAAGFFGGGSLYA